MRGASVSAGTAVAAAEDRRWRAARRVVLLRRALRRALRRLAAAGLRAGVYSAVAWLLGGAEHFANWLAITAVVPEMLRAVLRRGRRNRSRQDMHVAWLQKGMLDDDEQAAAERRLSRVGSAA